MSFEFAAVIRMTIVLAFAGLATLALKRSSAAIRCAVWNIALLCGFLVPLTDTLLPQPARLNLPVLPINESESVIVKTFVPESVATTVSSAVQEPPVNSSRPLSYWFAFAWALGLAFFLGRLIVASLSAMKLVRQAPPMSGAGWKSLMTELQGGLYISRRIELRCGGTAPPFTWGMFRHCVLLPSDADAWSPAQQRAVLAHELAHAKRFDGLVHFLVQIVCSAYWFNPIVWLAARRMRLERERACDDYALRIGAIPAAYAEQLMELASGENTNGLLATTSIAHPSQLETRIRAILNPKTRRGRISRWTAAVLLSSLTTVLFSVAAIHLTTLLSLSLPTSFAAMAAPPATPPIPEPVLPPVAAQAVTGSVAGRVVWADGAASAGAAVSAIATTREGLPANWVMGTKVAASTVTNSDGQYRIENLPPGLYHIVTGPVNLPRTFSDVSRSDSPHLATVTAGKTAVGMDFTCVRNSGGAVTDSNKTLTVSGKLGFQSFGGPSGPVVFVNNADGSVSHWQFRNTQSSPYSYWWPGLDAANGGVLRKMAEDGELVTVTGSYDGPSASGRWPTLHYLLASEVTRGGVPAR
jgi:beta-lactamase regulating signal transducer with metallopeptidase domain